MPARKQCQKLLHFSITKVSEMIVNYCNESSTQISSISGLLSGRNTRSSLVFNSIREQYIVPVNLIQETLAYSLNIWNETKFPTIDIEGNTYALIHYFWLRESSDWKFELGEIKSQSLSFMLQFNQNLRELKVSRTLESRVWEKILTRTPNLRTLHLSCRITCDAMLIIGKYASNLVKLCLYGEYCGKVYFISGRKAERLCFQDFPKCEVKNTICSSLQILEGRFDLYALLIILQNMKNLKSFKNCGSALNYTILASKATQLNKTLFPCKLEEIQFEVNNDQYTINDVFRNFPYLKMIHVNGSDLEKFNSRDILNANVDCIANVSLAAHAVPVIHSSWINLRKLTLYSSFHQYNVTLIDFSDISRCTPNLEVCLTNYKQKEVRNFTPFRKLDKLLVKGFDNDEVSIRLLKYVSCSLKSLGILGCVGQQFDVTDTTTSLNSLLTCALPLLEEMLCGSVHASDFDILELMNSMPSLKRFGLFDENDDDLRMLVEKECIKRNWDVELVKEGYSFKGLF